MTKTCKKSKGVILVGLIVILLVTLILTGSVFADESQKQSIDDNTSASLNKTVNLTKEEQEYLKKNPEIVVAADTSWRPLEYVDGQTGEYSGVIAEVFKKLEGYTGFKVKYKMMDSYGDALDAVKSGKADLISGMALDQDMAKEYNVNLTKKYLDITSAVVAKEEIKGMYKDNASYKIAVVEDDYANEEIQYKLKDSKLIECSSNEECLNMVKNDKVDMAIIASYCAEYYASVPKYSSLKTHTISDFSWGQAFGVSKDVDPMMIEILNKGIASMASTDINEAVYEGIINATYDNDFMIFLYKHPITVIGIFLLILLIIAALIITIFIYKKREHKIKLEDGKRLELALERTHLCIWEIDLNTRKVTTINNKHERHGFYDLRDNIPQSAIEKDYIHPEDVHLVQEAIDKIKAGQHDVKACWRVKDIYSEGEKVDYWWEQVLFRIVDTDVKKPTKIIGVSEDITKEKEAQKDALTLVYNRNSFEEMTNRILKERRNAYLECAFIILDLDGFKKINDTYGHGMGDRVLISVGSVLNKTFRETDVVGRLGGDEFTVFMSSISKKEDAIFKAKQVVEKIEKLQETDGYEFPISCSLGIVVARKGQDDFEVLYKKADAALYKAKNAGKNQYFLYED